MKELMAHPFISRSVNLQSRLFGYCVVELGIYARLGQFEKGLGMLQEITNGLKLYREKTGTIFTLSCYFMLAHLYFGAGRYPEALKWINRILDHPKKEVREDLRMMAMMAELIIHIELNNFDLFSSLARSVYRALQKKEKVYPLEAAVLAFVKKKYLSSLSQSDMPQNFGNDLRKKLAALEQNPFIMQMLIYFDLISWVESKLDAGTFSEIVRGNAGS
jgi:tetratricopeptide (TPR) repeat protein